MDNNSDNDSFGSFCQKKEHKSYLLQHNCLMKLKQIIYDNKFGYDKITIVIDNIPLNNVKY
jgi:hypothetical protein